MALVMLVAFSVASSGFIDLKTEPPMEEVYI
jgi:hypothetical protein